MNIKNILLLLFVGVSVAGVGYFAYKAKTKEKKELYRTSKFKRRTLTHIINATGSIEPENTISVGSLINGVVKELYVEENEQVKKSQLIALLDNGKGDTDVKSTAGLVKIAEAQLKYQTAFLARQKIMLADGHISQNDFDLAESNYLQAVGQLDQQKATHEKAVMDYDNTRIVSPIDGVVIKKDVSVGQGVSSFLMPTVLYTIAQDLTKMKVELEIDETSIGDLQIGKEAILTFDTYPNKEFRGNIKEINSGATITKGTVSYKSYVYISNEHLLLKPGMTVHADIIVAEKKNAFAVPGYIFSLNPKLVEFVAKEKKYGFTPLSKEDLQKFKDTRDNKPILRQGSGGPKGENPVRTVWIIENNTFVEKAIEIGITDKVFFEIISGLNGDEDIVIDVEETDVMKEMFKRLFGGGMSK